MFKVIVVGCEVGLNELRDCDFLEFSEKIRLVEVFKFLEEAFLYVLLLGRLLLSGWFVFRLHQFESTCKILIFIRICQIQSTTISKNRV